MTNHLPSRFFMNYRVNESLVRAEAAATAGRWIAQFVKQLAKAVRQRRQIAAIARLDDRTLTDIGLSRSDVRDIMSQPFWTFNPIGRKTGRSADDRSTDALARLDDDQICHLSETGQRLRREARRPRR